MLQSSRRTDLSSTERTAQRELISQTDQLKYFNNARTQIQLKH